METHRVHERFIRARARDEGVSRWAEVVGINAGGPGKAPTVNLRPLNDERQYEFDGEIQNNAALIYKEIPMAIQRSGKAVFIIPPEIGMVGFFVMTDYEVGETGNHEIERIKDRGSGWFQPAGSPDSQLEYSPDWAEIRSKDTRIAISEDEVHLQAGNANICIKDGRFDIKIGSVSLMAALKQMSAHIKILETIHGQVKPRTIDTITAATCPNRNESGA